MKSVLKVALIVLFLFNCSYAIQLNKNVNYRILGAQNAIQAHNALRARRQAQIQYYSNPLRNIRRPTSFNQYPNIQRDNRRMSKNQRYSVDYYNML
ncbi:hypothetical protein IJ670_08695 [bacterium]|nr:hypothetical protein [bacterium]